METDGVLAEINLEAFTECIGGQIEEVLKRNEKSHEVRSGVLLNKEIEKNDEPSLWIEKACKPN